MVNDPISLCTARRRETVNFGNESVPLPRRCIKDSGAAATQKAGLPLHAWVDWARRVLGSCSDHLALCLI